MLATCVGLFLFTRILIPDVMLTLTITLALWAFLRALDDEEPHPRAVGLRRWRRALGPGLLLKGLIAAVFPVAAALLYLLPHGQLLSGEALEAAAPVLRGMAADRW